MYKSREDRHKTRVSDQKIQRKTRDGLKGGKT